MKALDLGEQSRPERIEASIALGDYQTPEKRLREVLDAVDEETRPIDEILDSLSTRDLRRLHWLDVEVRAILERREMDEEDAS